MLLLLPRLLLQFYTADVAVFALILRISGSVFFHTICRLCVRRGCSRTCFPRFCLFRTSPHVGRMTGRGWCGGGKTNRLAQIERPCRWVREQAANTDFAPIGDSHKWLPRLCVVPIHNIIVFKMHVHRVDEVGFPVVNACRPGTASLHLNPRPCTYRTQK